MKLYLYGYSHGVDVRDQPVSLKEALQLIENQEDVRVERDNFIGFQIPNHEGCIQFSRISTIEWEVDIPVYKHSEFKNAFAGRTSTRVVRDITSTFFDNNSKLFAYISEENYDALRAMFKDVWGISLVEVTS